MATHPDHPVSEKSMLATVYRYQDFDIKKYILQNITLLEVSGDYNPGLGKKIEQLSSKISGPLGLDLSKVRSLQSAILSSLQFVNKKLSVSGSCFVLCNPPEKLIDLLNLNDLTTHFTIASDLTEINTAPTAISNDDVNPFQPTQPVHKPRAAVESPVSREILHINHNLRRTETLEKGLDSASQCVRKLLPDSPPRIIGYDFGFSYTPSDKVGGDFFDFILLDDDHLGVSIGDVSGHGLDSAIIMSMVKKIIRLRAQDLSHRSTADVLTKVNDDIWDEIGSGVFITTLYAKLNLQTGNIRFSRAGHEHPILFCPGSNKPPVVAKSSGIALGLRAGHGFSSVIREESIDLAKGTGLLLITDGLVECLNSRRDLFSRPRLLYTLEQLGNTSCASTVILKITAALEQFALGTAQEDDMTSIVILRE